MAVADAFAQFSTIIRENMGTSVYDVQMPEVDDPAEAYIAAMGDLGKGGRPDSGAGYVAKRKLKLSRGGMVTGGQWAGNTVQSLGTGDILPIGQSASARAPDPENVPLTQYATISCTLKRMLGNVVVNMSQILEDLIGDDIDEVAVGHMEDAAFQVRKQRLAWFYSDGTGMIAQADGTYTVDATAGGVAVGLKAGTIQRFVKGQRYYFFSTTSWPTTTTRKGGIARCVNIDDNANQVKFEMEAGESTASLVVNDNICLAGTLTTGTSGTSLVPHGIEYMFQEDDTNGTFYGLARATFPELVSYIEGNESSPIEPEPDRLAIVLDKMHAIGQAPPDMLVSEKSIMSQYGYMEKAGYASYSVPGYLPNPDGGVGTPALRHGTIYLPWQDSAYIRPGMIWGAARGTVEKFQPGGGETIRWWNGNGPGAGVGRIFVPVMDGTRQTELWQAPFETHVEYMALKPKRNFRYLGLRPLSDT